jgi:hypothetical protein
MQKIIYAKFLVYAVIRGNLNGLSYTGLEVISRFLNVFIAHEHIFTLCFCRVTSGVFVQ